jgi:hypothetical protein
MPREIVSHYGNTNIATHRLRDNVLAGEHARADWQPDCASPAEHPSPSLHATINDISVTLSLHVSSGEFSMLVSDKDPDSEATIVYGLTLDETVRILGVHQRQWLLDGFRRSINWQLDAASTSMNRRHHCEAREYMATAQEMSCALQRIEGDALKALRTVSIGRGRNGRHLRLVVMSPEDLIA